MSGIIQYILKRFYKVDFQLLVSNESRKSDLPLIKGLSVLKPHLYNQFYDAEQLLQKEIEEAKIWLNREHDESTDKNDLIKRIELINWVLENMKDPNVQIL